MAINNTYKHNIIQYNLHYERIDLVRHYFEGTVTIDLEVVKVKNIHIFTIC